MIIISFSVLGHCDLERESRLLTYRDPGVFTKKSIGNIFAVVLFTDALAF